MIMTCSECGYYECGEGCIWQSRAPDDIPPCEEEEEEDYTSSAEETLREQSVKRMEAFIAEREQKANDDYDAALKRINTTRGE